MERSSAASVKPAETHGRWTFLTNHSHVLILLEREHSLILRDVAARVGITERAVQRIVAELQEDGYLTIEKIGRKNTYQINHEKKLRHPIEQDRSIGDLLSVVK
ncbi:MAG: winged helix-turn-helix transcriptional regulator [Planctomycetaceae bacterium]|nr:winged helix-turn-helix transcriptional regulator [Planctomycetaceae bacterium]